MDEARMNKAIKAENAPDATLMKYWLGIIGEFREIANFPDAIVEGLHDYTTGEAWWWFNSQHYTIMPMQDETKPNRESSKKMFGDGTQWIYLGHTTDGLIDIIFDKPFA